MDICWHCQIYEIRPGVFHLMNLHLYLEGKVQK